MKNQTKSIIRFGIASVFIGCALAAYFIVNRQTTYEAFVEFRINESSPAAGAGLGSIFGQYGIGGSNAQLSQVEQLFKSRSIINKVLNTELVVSNAGGTTIEESLFSIYEIDTNLINTNSTILKDDVLNRVDGIKEELAYRFLIKESESPYPPLGILCDQEAKSCTIRSVTSEPELSALLMTKSFSELSETYINQKVSVNSKTITELERKRDSVLTRVKTLEIRIASKEGSQREMLRNEDRVGLTSARREYQGNVILYQELLKNVERTSFALKEQTPRFDIVNSSSQYILPSKESAIKILATYVLGCLILTLLGWYLYYNLYKKL